MQNRRGDPLDPALQPQPEISPNRPPQFKESTCGYRCGWGCCEPSDADGDSDGGGIDSEAGTTLLGNEEQNMRMRRNPIQRNFVVRGTPRPEGLPILGEIERQTGMVILANGYDERASNQESSFAPSTRMQEWDGTGNSVSEPRSGYLSSRHSNARTRGMPSPMSLEFNISNWIEDHAALFPLEYYFSEPPLRLSPQDGPSRGHLVSGRASHDDESMSDILEDAWRWQAVRNSNLC